MVEEITLENVVDDLGNATGVLIDEFGNVIGTIGAGIGNLLGGIPGLPPLPTFDFELPPIIFLVAAGVGGVIVGAIIGKVMS